jgi:group I intron endonuclease
MEKISGIYCYENKINHKKYIGKSRNIYRRKWGHSSQLKRGIDSLHFQRAWNKYGNENFEFYILQECEDDKRLLSAYEMYYIKLYKTRNPKFGYNLSDGGEGVTNPSAENRRKKRELMLGNTNGKKIKGQKRTEEQRKRMSDSRQNLSEEIREKYAVKKRGRKNTSNGEITSSKYVGVRLIRSGHWRVAIVHKGKSISLGIYATEEEAAIAYNRAALLYFGEEANLNNVEDREIFPLTKRQKDKNSSSKYHGVTYCNRDKNWKAHIYYDGRTHYIKAFKNEIDAAKAYNEKAIEIFGEKAVLNIFE